MSDLKVNTLSKSQLKSIVEATVFSYSKPISISKIQSLVFGDELVKKLEIEAALDSIKKDYKNRPIQLVELASGFCFQTKNEFGPWINRLWQDKPTKYSRALLETLALIAYHQPITRGEIEDVRGVSVSSNIIKTLSEREWIKVVGHKEVPGRPALYGTDKAFLDYFGLKSLSELPTLMEPESIELISSRLENEFSGSETSLPDKE
ncbi:SMC-Scp complex subunit ScpB [Psychrosphaera haliotis]|uniref:SMC-Scp complex subunit ScpB n=1 Tax=Psychrosphaera haliotis TaxID=555083 RepID=A0A6N8F8K7_9GAMM|nr:SMC-Scp complex subunit ScpB [Psychrosphaera haliotis]MUH71729.1 SMC-Scp complex subunit ScpB [Psychrosphaera haliotis]